MPAIRRPGELGARAQRERGYVTIHSTQDELHRYRRVGLSRCTGNRVKKSRVPVLFHQALLYCTSDLDRVIGIGEPPSSPIVLRSPGKSPINPVMGSLLIFFAAGVLANVASRVRKTSIRWSGDQP